MSRKFFFVLQVDSNSSLQHPFLYLYALQILLRSAVFWSLIVIAFKLLLSAAPRKILLSWLHVLSESDY